MRLLLLVAAALAFVSPVAAQPVLPQPGGAAPTTTTTTTAQPGALIASMTADQVAGLLNPTFPSKVTQDDKNSKWVITSFWGDSLYSGVLMNGTCDNNGSCTILGFFANFGKTPNVDQNWVNSWNENQCCVRAFFYTDQSLIFQYDVALSPGVTADYITSAAQLFKQAVDQSTNFKP
jgi:hypothetical protein